MATPREIFLELLKPDGHPSRQLVQYEALQMVLDDPVNAYLRAGRTRGRTSKDRWGTIFLFPADAPGAMPHITEDNKVCPDVTRWQEYVHAPDLLANCREGWEQCRARAREKAGSKRIVSGFMGAGIFEQCHYLMGFEDTLTALYEHPEEMHQLIDYITDYRLTFAKLLIDGLQPELLFTHDDWGTKDSLFMQPELWREFFKEPYRRFYGYIRSRGVIAVHHADSYLVPIVEDMAEIGIQVWQGVLPENDIPALQRQLQGRMVLMGGVGAALDREDAEAEEIRAGVDEVLHQCCPGGHFIPSITYGMPGAVFPQVDPVIDETIRAYNGQVHLPRLYLSRPVHRVRAAEITAAPDTSAAEETALLPRLSQALRRGQTKRVLQLTEQALAEGIPAEEILSGGLVDGMNRLGEDFSAKRAFVPEMLLAARCMTAAMERLKPLMQSGSGEKLGRVCLGTVRGDMHDIGKNLVKIMMEGSGLEVIDLGVDVSPEDMVCTAQAQHCDIIACSALLTTTMDEMRRVVELANQAHIREKVKIMVGGAPISQSFCDEIGADAYTEDAAQAARCAARLLQKSERNS